MLVPDRHTDDQHQQQQWKGAIDLYKHLVRLEYELFARDQVAEKI